MSQISAIFAPKRGHRGLASFCNFSLSVSKLINGVLACEFQLAKQVKFNLARAHFLAKIVKIDSFLHGSRVLSAWRAGRDSNP
jgi:hypothetical protein